jgi:hypothetical protein
MKLQIKTLEHSLAALANNRYSQWDISKCISYLTWLVKFKHIGDEQYDTYFKYVMYILNGEYEDFVSTHSFGGNK